MTLPFEVTDFHIYVLAFALLILIASFVELRRNEKDLRKRKKEIDQRIYETLILREIGERIGYELNIGKILDTITGSLNKLIPFSAVAYMLISDDFTKVNFKIFLEEAVPPKFLDTIRNHMLDNLNQLGPHRFGRENLTESITGNIIDENSKDQVLSLWIIPLTINNRGIGVLAVASSKAGLYHGSEMNILTQILSQANRAVNNLEAVISSEQAKLGAMVASIPDGILMVDKNMNLLDINPAAIKLLGLSGRETITILDVAQALSNKLDIRGKIEESKKEEKIVVIDNLIIEGEVSKLLISPVKDSNNQFLGTVIVFHSVTAEKQLERIREEFTAMMVHELRAPLTVVRGTTDMLIRKPDLAGQPPGQLLLKTMENSTSSMLSLVNDLLDIAKIESGKFEILPTAGDLKEIINDRIVFFSQLANPKSISLESVDSGDDLHGNFDRERITQVLNNLLSNAIQATSVGGKINVSAKKIGSAKDIVWRYPPGPNVTIEKPCILVSITDTGVGIAPEKIPELFSKFRQLRKNGPGSPGTGLGLVIAKGIIESHHGQIFLESRPNEGTTFYFTLPLS